MTMESNDERLRALFQSLPRETPEGEPCPTPDELWAAVRGESAPAELRRVIEHTGRCPGCAEDWRIARRLSEELAPEASARAETVEGVTEAAPSAADGRGAAPDRTWPAAAMGFAAALLLAVGVALFGPEAPGPRGTTQPGPIYRDPGTAATESLLGSGEALPRSAPVLRWDGPEGAIYDLTVTTEDLALVAAESGLAGTNYELPPDAVAGLPGGTVLLWRLEAVLPDGSRLSSRTFRTVLEDR